MAEGPGAGKLPYSPVTDARLQNPEPRNWLAYRGNYAGWGYSPLEKVNNKNVSKLQLAWSFTTGVQEGTNRLRSSMMVTCSSLRLRIR
jgi:glucose dehydrogenase